MRERLPNASISMLELFTPMVSTRYWLTGSLIPTSSAFHCGFICHHRVYTSYCIDFSNLDLFILSGCWQREAANVWLKVTWMYVFLLENLFLLCEPRWSSVRLSMLPIQHFCKIVRKWTKSVNGQRAISVHGQPEWLHFMMPVSRSVDARGLSVWTHLLCHN